MIPDILHWLGSPFRMFRALAGAIINLSSTQVKSLFSVAMLGGIVSLSAENWTIMYLAQHAVEQGDTFRAWFEMLLERTRYNSILQGFFAFIMGLVVFGADFFRAKIAGHEIEAGRRAE